MRLGTSRPRAVLRRALAALATLVLVASVGTGCADRGAGTAPGAPAPDGTFARSVDIGGRTLYLTCAGRGSPTVVLESGIHDSSSPWTSVTGWEPPAVGPRAFEALARRTRVCAYDRPGTLVYSDGEAPRLTTRSSPVPMPRTARDVVSDLHTLLQVAHVPGPYLLVPHSMGGLFALLYARTYPADVVGMVLVDIFSPSVPALVGTDWPAYRTLLNAPGTPFDHDPRFETVDIDRSIRQLGAAPPLRPVPVAVLSKTEPFATAPGTDPALLQHVERVWPLAQAHLVDLAPQTPQTLVTGSSHYVQVQAPDVLAATVGLVLTRIARGAGPPTTVGS